jgi:hypothetical protein
MRDVFRNPNRSPDDTKQDYFHKMGVFDKEKEFYKVLLVEITFVKIFMRMISLWRQFYPFVNELENKQCRGVISTATSAALFPRLDESNSCSYAANVFCFSRYDCCNMLYNSRQALNQKDNPRAPVKYTGNRVGALHVVSELP